MELQKRAVRIRLEFFLVFFCIDRLLFRTGSPGGSCYTVRKPVYLGCQYHQEVLLRMEGAQGVQEKVPRDRWTEDRPLHAELHGEISLSLTFKPGPTKPRVARCRLFDVIKSLSLLSK